MSSVTSATGAPVTTEEAALVFRRAAELDAGVVGGDPEALLDGRALEEVGQEVGLSPASVRTALAELRRGELTPGPEGPERVGRRIVVTRTVPGPRVTVAMAVDELARRNLLGVRRHSRRAQAEVLVWGRRSGPGVSLLRAGSSARRRPLLALSSLTASVAERPGMPGRVDVRLEGRLLGPRRVLRARTQALAATGVGSGLLLGANVIGSIDQAVDLLWLGLSAGAVGGAGTAAVRAHGEAVQAAEDALGYFLDRQEVRQGARGPAR